MSNLADIELAFYEQFFLARDLEPYPAQEQALEHIFGGDSLLVTVPTGTGKTLIAKAALYKAVKSGQRAVYTTPLRALTEEKYRELCEDFGPENVGFATGDFKENRDAPIQVVVAEILWNGIFADHNTTPADVVVMDEGHYFNDFERGYVWEQTIIGLHPKVQLVILSATVGHADRFCHWAEMTRRAPMRLVESRDRTVPLAHEFQEAYLVEVVRELASTGQYPAILFTFGREMCFENARLLKSCRRFVTDEEREEIARRCDEALHPEGAAGELRSLLMHGIGIHHAGILPRYKQLVESLTLDRLLKFVVATETISSGINLPAKVVVFPSLRKVIKGKPRLLTSAEFHQMSGRAGRPQFDDKGLAIVLAPDEVVQEIRKEIKDCKKKGWKVDEEKIRKSAYSRALADAQRKESATWSKQSHDALINGEPAELTSHTRVTAEQVLAIGLPDLTTEALPGEEVDLAAAEQQPAYTNLNVRTVIDHLLLPERERRGAHKLLAQVTDNLRAMEIIDERGQQVTGEMIGKLPGIDGLFVYYVLREYPLDTEEQVQLIEYLVDHQIVHKVLTRKDRDERRNWIRARLREARQENPQVSWEDIEEEYDKKFPPELSRVELIHSEFVSKVAHPQLHGGKVQKRIWAQFEEDPEMGFFDFVSKHGLTHEEGSLFSYLTRTLRVSAAVGAAAEQDDFLAISERVRSKLAVVDPRLAKIL